MPLKKDDSGRRFVEMEFLVPGTPEQVWQVTSRSGDRCVVRMVHSLFTEKDDWDDELESFETGWPGFFEVLRVYLTNFAGKPAASVRAMVTYPGSQAAVWSSITEGLNLAGVNVGDRRETPSDTPRLAGVVERVRQDANSRELMLRLAEPAEGIAVIGSFAMGDEACGMASIYFYGADVADTAAAEQAEWTRWLAGLLQRVPDPV
jgi:hypothetical protein